MASYTGGGDGRGYSITLYMDELSTDPAANTSYVHVYAYLNASYQYFANWTGSGSLQVNGTVVQYYGGKYSMPGTNSSIQIGDWYGTVGHQNTNGTGTIYVYSDFSIPGGASYTPNSPSAGYTFGLSDLNRSAGTPASCSATLAGGVFTVAIGAATSYINPFNYYTSYASSSDGGVTYGTWSSDSTAIPSTTSPLVKTYSGLTPGLTYKFRVRAYNGVDSYSAYKESSPVFMTAGGKRYTSSNTWVLTATAAKVKRSTGTGYVPVTTAKRFDGYSWVNLT
jgi:hypothetical protein